MSIRSIALRVIGDISGTDPRFALADGELRHLSVSKYATLKDAFGEYLNALPRKVRPLEESLQLSVQYP